MGYGRDCAAGERQLPSRPGIAGVLGAAAGGRDRGGRIRPATEARGIAKFTFRRKWRVKIAPGQDRPAHHATPRERSVTAAARFRTRAASIRPATLAKVPVVRQRPARSPELKPWSPGERQ